MLMALVSRIIGAWFAFLIPAYSTWKALSHRPLSEPDLERWVMYWTCVGAFVAFENVAEWFISWFPFYWELRTIFLLFLALPQTQGSTFVFKTYLDPYFRKNEADLDSAIVAAQTNTISFAQAKLTALWEALWRIATKSANAAAANGTAPAGAQNPSAPSQASAPNPANVLAMGANLFHTYGPWAMGAIKSSMGPAQAQAATANANANTNGQSPLPTPPAVPASLSPGLQQRSPFASRESVVTPASSHSNQPPSFPEPQYH